MTSHRILLAALVSFVAMFAQILSAGTISVNFRGGQGGNGNGTGAANVTSIAGAVPVGNWNNALTAAGSLLGVLDSSGAATTANVSWSVGNTWATGAAPGGGGNGDMMTGYLDNFGGQTITVTNIPLSVRQYGYEVLVYFNNDNAGSTSGYTATDNLSNTDTRFGHQIVANANYPLAGPNGFIGSTQTSNTTTFSSNYVLLTGLSGSNLTILGVNGLVGNGRARPNGFQIVGLSAPIPEPTSVVLVGLGLAGLVLRRRRK